MSPKDTRHPSRRFPDGVAKWLAEHGSLIDALVLLRLAGTEPDAVDALMALRPVHLLRASWELWPNLGFDQDADSEELLAARLPAEVLVRCRYALWGTPPPGWDVLRVV